MGLFSNLWIRKCLDATKKVNVNPFEHKPPENPARKKSAYCWSWRYHPIMQFPIRAQRKFETCWSTSAADAVSCKLKIQHPNTDPFVVAPQELIDRVHQIYHPRYIQYSAKIPNSYSSTAFVALDYIKDFGITLEAHHPYKGEIQDRPIPEYPRYRITEIRSLLGAPLRKVIKAIGNQPVIGRISSCEKFRNFRGRKIYRRHTLEPSEEPVNHAVLIVGYGKDKYGRYYYIIRNLWGDNCGDGGYAKVSVDLIKALCYPGDVIIDEE